MADFDERLAALRAKFADSAEFHDPRFRRVGDKIFSGGTRLAPYAGIPTFASLPSKAIDFKNPDFGDLQVAVIGVPMDLGVSNRPGSRFGPRAMRSIERIGPYNHVLDCAPGFDLRMADVGDIPFASRYRLEESHKDIEAAISKVVGAGVIPVSIGGDHSITHPILKAVGRDRPVGLIHIDAHCDTGGPFDQTKFHHGGPMRNAVLDGVLDPVRTIQIGIRGPSEYLWEFSYASGMTVIHGEEVPHMGIGAIIEKARQVVGGGPTYLSFDIDSLDPSFAPGTGTPEIGGLTTREVLELIRGLKGVNLVGADVVEVAPQYDSTTNTAQAGAQVLFEILSLLTFSPALA
ncbi:agmatinase [Mesorhizobium sp. M1A.F.Ca.IN.020.06.1.1]|uniref:agmatinase n=1 Tax=unclassified Mesorhizobium TaxID=325217 RepID=UPI000FC9CAB5|nr:MULTISPECIES: agmatinase [unclassified Mesorhizobium]RUV84683.1 agmatinase [Mesorhizobium sp. M1A.F.Ca.IN.020.32.1.1]RUW03789.1 agmatinase [Mesorhizobium sp. M1A.F.Ca.IN.022.05.2.1]RUW20691.1 agmatinase [Mesorhizobium sp. M1A.F.Ca.IN.020.06.1.1]RWF81235.1 MAG: agmatinase [Mesorhizobium sp.]RWG92707.1 MAG: agmatinase [Mesorhizobium sp.]